MKQTKREKKHISFAQLKVQLSCDIHIFSCNFPGSITTKEAVKCSILSRILWKYVDTARVTQISQSNIFQDKCLAKCLASFVPVRYISNYLVVPKEVSPLIQTFMDN